MDPVCIKLYGLISLTRRRYLTQVSIAGVCVVAVLIAWWLYWKPWHDRLVRQESPPTAMIVIVAILDQLPWVLLAAVAVQAFEMWVVLRRFARKEAERRTPKPSPSP